MTASEPLTPERLAEIREWRDELGRGKTFDLVGPYSAINDLLAEIDRLRAIVQQHDLDPSDAAFAQLAEHRPVAEPRNEWHGRLARHPAHGWTRNRRPLRCSGIGPGSETAVTP